MSQGQTGFSSLYPTMADLVEKGVGSQVNAGRYWLQIAGLNDEGGTVGQFRCHRMSATEILDHLKNLAIRRKEEGIATDEGNGAECKVW